MESEVIQVNDDSILKELQLAGWRIDHQFWESLSDFSRSFMRDEMTGFGTWDFYEQRIQALGFVGLEKVLDAACGNGQWVVVLASLNKDVYGIDIDADSVAVASRLAKAHGCTNTTFQCASMDQLPYPAEHFDAVVCYSALMYSDYLKTLCEFNRVLKPGGRAYISVDSRGWLLYLLLDKGLRKLLWADTVKYGRRFVFRFYNQIRGRTKNLVITRGYFKKLIARSGFNVVKIGPEGSIAIDKRYKPTARYPRRQYGFETIIDVVIEKKANHANNY